MGVRALGGGKERVAPPWVKAVRVGKGGRSGSQGHWGWGGEGGEARGQGRGGQGGEGGKGRGQGHGTSARGKEPGFVLRAMGAPAEPSEGVVSPAWVSHHPSGCCRMRWAGSGRR